MRATNQGGQGYSEAQLRRRTILSLKVAIRSDQGRGKNIKTHKSQMTFEPVLQPRRVTMWPLMHSYKRARCSLSAYIRQKSFVSTPGSLKEPIGISTVGSTLAINWLPVTDSARSTIIALLDLRGHARVSMAK